MNASVNDLEGLLNWLERIGALDGSNKDLVEDAIFALKSGNEYRAQERLKVAEYNYRRNGNNNAADAVKRLL